MPLRDDPDSQCREPRMGNPLGVAQQERRRQILADVVSNMKAIDRDGPRCMPPSMFPEIETRGLREAVSDLSRRVAELERRLDARSPQSRSDLLETLADSPEATAIRDGLIVNRKA